MGTTEPGGRTCREVNQLAPNRRANAPLGQTQVFALATTEGLTQSHVHVSSPFLGLTLS